MSFLTPNLDPEGEQPQHWPTTVSMDHRDDSSGLSRFSARSMMRRIQRRLSRLMAPSSLATAADSPTVAGSFLVVDRVGLRDNATIPEVDSDSEYTFPTLSHNEAALVIFDIPPELFDHILSFVGLSQPDTGRHTPTLSGSNTRTKLLQNCALVCRYWANQCRKYLFHGATLKIYSYKSLESLFRYALHGSPFLIPIHTLISRINVIQTYNEPSSFLHCVFSFKLIADKQLELFQLELKGPIPFEFPACKLDTPHRSLPSTIATPPSLLPYRIILFSKIHLPSFMHVAKYIGHFKLASHIRLYDLTWDDGGPPELSTEVVRGLTRRISDEYFTLRASGCTDNTRIALQAISTNKHSPLHILSGHERETVIMWINEFSGRDIWSFEVKTTWTRSKSGASVEIDFDIDECSLSLTLHNFKPDESQATTTPIFLVSGLKFGPSRITAVTGSETSGITSNLNYKLAELQTYINRFSVLRAIAIIFCDYDQLLVEMEVYRRNPSNTTILQGNVVLVCKRWPSSTEQFPEVARLGMGPDWIGIDPVTLSSNGQVWMKENHIIPSLLSAP